MGKLKEKIDALPPEDQKEVERLVEHLLQKNGKQQATPLNQSWAGALKEYRDEYTSGELKKKALNWRQE